MTQQLPQLRQNVEVADESLTVRDVAKCLSASEQTARALINKGAIPSFKAGPRMTRVLKTDLLQFVESKIYNRPVKRVDTPAQHVANSANRSLTISDKGKGDCGVNTRWNTLRKEYLRGKEN